MLSHLFCPYLQSEPFHILNTHRSEVIPAHISFVHATKVIVHIRTSHEYDLAMDAGVSNSQ